MNRCPPRPTHRVGHRLLHTALLIGLSAMAAASSAQDVLRRFPASAKAGTLEVTAPPDILIDGQAARLSPGARIKSADNLLVLSGRLVGQRLPVAYRRDPHGLVHEVWILSTAEAQRTDMPVISNITFGADADKPKTDDGKTPFDQLPKFPAR